MSEIADLTAVAALARIRAGRLDGAEWRAACLARIAAREGEVRAFAHFDASAVRATRTHDGRAHDGRAHDGVLGGMPLGVKDVLDTADMPREYG